MEIGFEATNNPFRFFYLFMPRGTMLLLGRVLLMYWHSMTRLVRDLLYIQATDFRHPLVIGPTTLTTDQLEAREF